MACALVWSKSCLRYSSVRPGSGQSQHYQAEVKYFLSLQYLEPKNASQSPGMGVPECLYNKIELKFVLVSLVSLVSPTDPPGREAMFFCLSVRQDTPSQGPFVVASQVCRTGLQHKDGPCGMRMCNPTYFRTQQWWFHYHCVYISEAQSLSSYCLEQDTLMVCPPNPSQIDTCTVQFLISKE